jgi:hypothetical protein
VREDLAVEVKRDRLIIQRGSTEVEGFPSEIRHLVNALSRALVGSRVVGVLSVLLHSAAQVSLAQDQEMAEALLLQAVIVIPSPSQSLTQTALLTGLWSAGD